MNEVLYLNEEYAEKVDKSRKSVLFKALCLIFFVGVFYGGYISKGQDNEIIRKVSEIFFKTRTEEDFATCFFSSVFSGGVFVIFLCLNGFSAIGQTLSFFTVFLNGMGFGTAIVSLYFSMGTKGILFSLLLLVPTYIISGFLVLLSARESVRLSNRIFVLLIKGKSQNDGNIFSKYIKKFIIIFVFVIISALLSGAFGELIKHLKIL